MLKSEAPNVIKVYKFRSLGDDTVTWTKRIIETGEFWCSHLWEQNDSMEGVYSYWQNHEISNSSIDIFDQKNSYRICSFSGKAALKDPRMWGYYANGFKGLAIEIEILSDEIKKVDYQNSLLWADTNSPNIKKIITTKLKWWKHECEYRYLKTGRNRYEKIGSITGIYFGDPHGSLQNRNQIIANSPKLQDYIRNKEDLIKQARLQEYPCLSASFVKKKEKWKFVSSLII